MHSTTHIRNGAGVVRPYVFGPRGLLPFLERTFSAQVVEASPDGGEVEIRIGDSAVALALGDQFPEGVATRASVYAYVPDADATYELALRNGATSIFPPEDKPYEERVGGVRDDFGNVWYIATFLGASK
jgi:PhnB protein